MNRTQHNLGSFSFSVYQLLVRGSCRCGRSFLPICGRIIATDSAGSGIPLLNWSLSIDVGIYYQPRSYEEFNLQLRFWLFYRIFHFKVLYLKTNSQNITLIIIFTSVLPVPEIFLLYSQSPNGKWLKISGLADLPKAIGKHSFSRRYRRRDLISGGGRFVTLSTYSKPNRISPITAPSP